MQGMWRRIDHGECAEVYLGTVFERSCTEHDSVYIFCLCSSFQLISRWVFEPLDGEIVFFLKNSQFFVYRCDFDTCVLGSCTLSLIPSWNFWPFTLKNYGFTLQKYQFLFMFEIPTCLFGNCMLSLFTFIIWSDSRLEMWPLNKRNMISFVKVLIFFHSFNLYMSSS